MIRIIAVYKSKTDGIMGYRVLNEKTLEVGRVNLEGLHALVQQFGSNHITFTERNLKLTDGSLNSLPTLNNGADYPSENDVLIVLSALTISDAIVGYRVCDFQGRPFNVGKDSIINLESRGFANAKVVTRVGNKYLSAIRGTFPTEPYTGSQDRPAHPEPVKVSNEPSTSRTSVPAPTVVSVVVYGLLVTKGLVVESFRVSGSGLKADDILDTGKRLIASMTEEQRSILCSKSKTLHLSHYLGFESSPVTRSVSVFQSVKAARPVGAVFYSDIDIVAPQINPEKTVITGVTDSDISYVSVKAGEFFALTFIEAMYLLVQPEYGGFADGQDIYFSPKLPKYIKGEQNLPTPTINRRTSSSSLASSMETIDYATPTGWEVKEQYLEKFGPMLDRQQKTTASEIFRESFKGHLD